MAARLERNGRIVRMRLRRARARPATRAGRGKSSCARVFARRRVPSEAPSHRADEIAHQRHDRDDRDDRDHQQREAGIELHRRRHRYVARRAFIGLRAPSGCPRFHSRATSAIVRKLTPVRSFICSTSRLSISKRWPRPMTCGCMVRQYTPSPTKSLDSCAPRASHWSRA